MSAMVLEGLSAGVCGGTSLLVFVGVLVLGGLRFDFKQWGVFGRVFLPGERKCTRGLEECGEGGNSFGGA